MPHSVTSSESDGSSQPRARAAQNAFVMSHLDNISEPLRYSRTYAKIKDLNRCPLFEHIDSPPPLPGAARPQLRSGCSRGGSDIALS